MASDVRNRLIVWVGLLAFLALTVGLTFLPMGPWRLPASLAIAASKAFLVGWVFMELRTAPPLVRVVAAAALAMLMLLIALSGIDAAVRSGALPWL